MSFFTGTNPVDLHVVQLNDDDGNGSIDDADRIDLVVANEGSNDISILLGGGDTDSNGDGTIDQRDLFRPGPRLSTGAFAASSVSTSDIDADGIQAILAFSAQGNTATMIRGLAQGFFDDVGATTVDLPAQPLDPDGPLVIFDNGDVARIDFLGGRIDTLFDAEGRSAAAFQTVDVAGLSFPVFLTANTDGTVSALVSDNGLDYFEAKGGPREGVDNPSALAVLEGAGGVEVYMANGREGDLLVLRFGIDELVPELVSAEGGASLALVATLPNSLVIENRAESLENAVDPNVVFGGEEAAGDLAVIDGVFVSAGEPILSALEEEGQTRTEEETPSEAVATENLQQFLVGLDESLRKLGWKHSPDEEPGASEFLLGQWLQQGREVIDRLMQLYQAWVKSQPPPAAESDDLERQNIPEAREVAPGLPDESSQSMPSEESDQTSTSAASTERHGDEPTPEASEAGPLSPLLLTALFASGLYAGRGWRRIARGKASFQYNGPSFFALFFSGRDRSF